MNEELKVIAAAAARVILYGLLVASMVGVIYLDAITEQSAYALFGENSLVELTQAALLAAMTVLLVYSAATEPAMRISAIAAAAFTLVSLIRENDDFFDQFWEEAWETLVVIVLIPTAIFMWRYWRRLIQEQKIYMQTMSYGLFLAGFTTTYVFSRLFGMRMLWDAIMRGNLDRTMKNLSEECMELFGYTLLLIAMVEFVIMARRLGRSRNPAIHN